jgi:hypothetical protein
MLCNHWVSIAAPITTDPNSIVQQDLKASCQVAVSSMSDDESNQRGLHAGVHGLSCANRHIPYNDCMHCDNNLMRCQCMRAHALLHIQVLS